MLEQGKDSTSEIVAETTGDDLTITPILSLPALMGEKAELGRKEGRKGEEKVYLRFYFTSHYASLILLAINSVNISDSNLFCL